MSHHSSQTHATESLPIEIWEKVFTHLRQDLIAQKCLKGLLPVRLTSREWKLEIDKLSQSFQHYSKTKRDVDLKNPTIYQFYTVQQINRFLNTFSSSNNRDLTTNPFITRFVCLENQEENDRYWEAVRDLMKLFGKEIWYCQISIGSLPNGKCLYKDVIHSLVSQMLNLRALTIVNDLEQCDPMLQLDDFYLPVFQNLRELDLQNLPRSVSHELIRVGDASSLTNFGIGGVWRRYMEEECDYQELLRFQNLQKVSFRDLTLRASLSAMQASSWPLQQALLRVQLSSQNEGISMRCLFQTLAHFGTTLIHLNLTLCGESHPDRDLRLQLPVLEYLKITVRNQVRFYSLDFLIGLNNLKKLELSLDEEIEEHESPESLIRFNGYTSRMMDSNIWTVLPQLQTFLLSVKGNQRKFHRGI